MTGPHYQLFTSTSCSFLFSSLLVYLLCGWKSLTSPSIFRPLFLSLPSWLLFSSSAFALSLLVVLCIPSTIITQGGSSCLCCLFRVLHQTPFCMVLMFTSVEGYFFLLFSTNNTILNVKPRSNIQCIITVYSHVIPLFVLSLWCSPEYYIAVCATANETAMSLSTSGEYVLLVSNKFSP